MTQSTFQFKKPTQHERILSYLQENNCEIDNGHAVHNMYIMRLSERIRELELAGKIVVEDKRFIGKSKNYRYKVILL